MESSYIKTSGGIITSSFINEIFNDENNSEYLLPETYKIHENERIDRTILRTTCSRRMNYCALLGMVLLMKLLGSQYNKT